MLPVRRWKKYLRTRLPSLLTGWDFLVYLWREYGARGLRQQAAALTYVSLFAVVPLLTVVFTMFSLFPAFEGMSDTVQEFLFMHLMPDSGLEIQQYIDVFTQQARSLTLVGVLILLVTAFLMIRNIESTFNLIWGVETPRQGLSSFLLYWAVLTLGPLLLGVGLAMSTYVLSLRLFVDEYDSLGLLPLVLSYFPWLLTTLAFTLLYVAVPNCKVAVSKALVGGALTAICFELCKNLFGWIVANSSFTAVYGAFAMVPLFLLWIYILWMIVLVGALLVRSLSSFQDEQRGINYPDLVAALVVLWVFYRHQQQGRVLDPDAVLEAGVETLQWQRLREALLQHHMIVETTAKDHVLCCDLHSLTLAQVLAAVGVEPLSPGEDAQAPDFAWYPALAQRLGAVDRHAADQLELPLAQLFAQVSTEGDLTAASAGARRVG